MFTSDTTAQLNAAMALAQGQMKPALKDAENPHFRSRYADLASILDACRAPLSANGIAVYQALSTPDPTRLAVTTRLGHKSGEFIEETVLFPVGQNTAQAYGSAATYARRYALSSILCIAADDDDGEAASAPPPKPPIPIQRDRARSSPQPLTPAAAIPVAVPAAPVTAPTAAKPSVSDQDARVQFELVASVVKQFSPSSFQSIMTTHGVPLDLQWEEGHRPVKLGNAYRALKAEADRITNSKEPK